MARLILMRQDADKLTLVRYRAYLRDVMLPQAQAIRAREVPTLAERLQAISTIKRRARYEKWQPLVDRGDAAKRLSPEEMERLVAFMADYEANPVTDAALREAEEVAEYAERRQWANRIALVEALKTDAELAPWIQQQADARPDRGDLMGVFLDSWDSQEHTNPLFCQLYLPTVDGTPYRRYLAAGTGRPRLWRLVYADLPAAARLAIQNNGIAQVQASALVGAWINKETGARE